MIFRGRRSRGSFSTPQHTWIYNIQHYFIILTFDAFDSFLKTAETRLWLIFLDALSHVQNQRPHMWSTVHNSRPYFHCICNLCCWFIYRHFDFILQHEIWDETWNFCGVWLTLNNTGDVTIFSISGFFFFCKQNQYLLMKSPDSHHRLPQFSRLSVSRTAASFLQHTTKPSPQQSHIWKQLSGDSEYQGQITKHTPMCGYGVVFTNHVSCHLTAEETQTSEVCAPQTTTATDDLN